MTKRSLLLFFFTILFISTNIYASNPFGTASDYNLFVINDLVHTGGDSEGAVAAGGNAQLSSYGVGNKLPNGGNAEGYGMVIGGNLNFQNGQSYHGDVHVGGTATLNSATILDGQLVNPSYPIDFSAEESYLLSLSAYWKDLTANGTHVLQPWGRLDLTGTSNDLNIFYLDASTWQGTKEVAFHVPSSSKVIVNIAGTSDNIPSSHGNFGSIFLNGASKTKIVWNFFEATNLHMQNMGWQGSILAPKADFTYLNGNVEGNLIVKSCTMTKYSGEVHDYPLDGDFPQPDEDEPENVIPILECVVKNSDNTYTAHFIYDNPNSETIEIPVGSDNYFSPAPQDRGQTTIFTTNGSLEFPESDFEVTWDGNTDLTWTLNGETATASTNSPFCSEQIFFEKEWYDENGSLESSIPSNLPSNYKIEVTSEFGTATGVYNSGTLVWTYDNTPSYSNNNGLWVPINGNYVVKELNLPTNYSAYEGVGTFTASVTGGYASNPYNGNDAYALHIIKNQKEAEDCATSAVITFGADSSICDMDADSLTVNGAVSITPNPSSAKIKTTWQLLFPDSTENDNSIYYSTIDISGDTTFSITGYWPGVTSEDTKVELLFTVEVLDCDGNTIENAVSRKIYWNTSVCPAPDKEEADLELHKSVNNALPENGDEITFTIELKNNGPKDAPNVEVSELLPSGLNYVTHSTSKGTYNSTTGIWNVGNVTNGATETLTITAEVDASGSSTSSLNLGVAADYNVFIIKDINQPSSDTEGKMAVGRNAELSNYSVGDKLATFGDDVLVVGKNLAYNSGRVYNGNVIYGNSTNLPIGATSIDGDLAQGSPIDFTAAETYLKNLSTQLKSFAVNGTTTVQWSTLSLSGTDPFLNVFSVDGSDIESTTSFEISVPNGSVVIVNIKGKSISWSGGLTINGTDKSNVMYNFYNAKNLEIAYIDVQGTILAPNATVDFPSGVVNGQMIAKFLTGSVQFNNCPFIGNIPVDTSFTNVAEVYASGIKDPDSTPNNGAVDEDDYDFAVVTVNYSDSSTGSGNGSGNGEQWENIGSFGIDEIVYSLTTDTNGFTLAGTWGGNIYRSSSNDEWIKINDGMNVAFIWSIAVNQSNGFIYVATEQGIFVSEDNGTSWQQTNISMDVRALGIDSNGNLFAGTWGLGIYKSTDNGQTWTEVNSGLDFKIVNSIVVDSNDDVYAATFGGGVYKTGDHGNSWVKLSVGYNYIWSLGVTSTNNIYAGSYGKGVFYSKDGGNSWSQANGSLPAVYVYAISIDSDDNVYISTWANGVYKTNDAGLSWSSFGLAGTGVSSLLLNQSTGEIYAGTSDGNILAVSNSITGIDNPKEDELPQKFELSQNYPNPFNPSTTIKFSVKDAGKYSLKIYNILGQLVTTLIDSDLNPGSYDINFNASKLASGIYLYNLTGKNVNMTKKMILIK